ncbi:histidine decarboxylase-like [Bacillus rossius redtenbacheri]|uniref:histidine decarboxylase-like n=1 Tax=Bacillus rossius redtenbacheri TaxID=93214 RepID=UPI002FDE9143
MVDYIADYMGDVRARRVVPDVTPGFLSDALPREAPVAGAPWDSVMRDFERLILPGVAHSQSPHMHAYSAVHSPPALLGDMLAGALNCLSFTWDLSPACTELDAIVTDWLAGALGLPAHFLNAAPRSPGGGVFQNTSSEALLVTLLSARERAVQKHGDLGDLGGRLVAYCSDQAHPIVAKGCRMCRIQLHVVHSDEEYALRGDRLREAIASDRQMGLVPFYMCATLGSTFACSFDNLSELGPVCASEGVWLHVDAAYAGTAFACPEFRGWLAGVEHADSLSFLPCKIMLVNFYSCVMW